MLQATPAGRANLHSPHIVFADHKGAGKSGPQPTPGLVYYSQCSGNSISAFDQSQGEDASNLPSPDESCRGRGRAWWSELDGGSQPGRAQLGKPRRAAGQQRQLHAGRERLATVTTEHRLTEQQMLPSADKQPTKTHTSAGQYLFTGDLCRGVGVLPASLLKAHSHESAEATSRAWASALSSSRHASLLVFLKLRASKHLLVKN